GLRIDLVTGVQTCALPISWTPFLINERLSETLNKKGVHGSARIRNVTTTYYALTARIGDKIYELHSGMRFGLGEFPARVTKFGIDLLTTDAKGRLVAVSSGIAKESLATAK